MDADEVKEVMNFSIEELSMAQILFGAGNRGSITHSDYAMFDVAKALYAYS